MKLKKMSRFGLVAAAALPLCSGYGQSPVVPTSSSTAVAPATNNNSGSPAANLPSNVAEVVKLSEAGLGDAVVLAYVKNSRSLYNLKADDILQLKEAGVSSEVISAMLNHDRSLLNQSQGQHVNPSAPFNYNQQWYPPGSQPEPGQSFAQPPRPQEPAPDMTQVPPQSQAPSGPSPADMSAAQVPPPQVEVVPVAPNPDFYWAPGYWWWDGGWIWIGGGWFPRGSGWGYHGGWGYRGGWGGYHRGGGFRGGHRW